MGSEVEALGRWVQKPVVSGRSLGPRTIDINLQTDKRHGPYEPSGGGTEHLAGGIVLGGGRRNRNIFLAGYLLKPGDPVSGHLGRRSELLDDWHPDVDRGGDGTDSELRPGSSVPVVPRIVTAYQRAVTSPPPGIP